MQTVKDSSYWNESRKQNSKFTDFFQRKVIKSVEKITKKTVKAFKHFYEKTVLIEK